MQNSYDNQNSCDMQNSRDGGGSFVQNTYAWGYAGFFVRMSAYLIDSLIVGAVLLAVRIPLAAVTAVLPEAVRSAHILFAYTITDIILYGAHAAYFILLTYCTGTTLGKRLFRLQVVSQGEKPSLWNIVYRETIGRFLSGVCLGAGYLMVGIDKEKRGIHDILANTRVIYERTFR